jgi:predicted ATPase/class 3 adenylate cyclase/Tfp pilus assembly protein PilF
VPLVASLATQPILAADAWKPQADNAPILRIPLPAVTIGLPTRVFRRMAESLVLLLSDVVDSTHLSQKLGDAVMTPVWEAHDRMSRELIREWRGREVARSDGFLLLFGDVGDAVGFSIAYHRMLAALEVPLTARIGMHLGPVSLRENSTADTAQGAPVFEVDGVALPIAARVMSTATGGQTLLTAMAMKALGDTRVRVHAHGFWRFKGIGEPIELFEIGDQDAPFAPPPDSAKAYCVVRVNDLWLPRRQIRSSLPAERDEFVGRQTDLLELADRFERGARIVSLLGAAGTGKTRLATRFGWGWLGDYPGGVWFCDLSPARSLDGIVHAVARGLEVPLGRVDPVVQLAQVLAARGDCLVVLDNFEQVVSHARETLGIWLDRAVEARFLVTSRQVLGLPGEEVIELPPLPAHEGCLLFLRRAEAASPSFHLEADDRAAIAPLIRLLDGLPLAIELAAARTRVMAPRTLLSRMRDRFKVLATGGGARLGRQATLRGAFDWSWDLLSPAEKTALAQLSVFEHGFTLAAAESLLDLSACGSPWTVDVVQSLVEKSLVRRASGARLELLQSVQEYAGEHLANPGRFDGSGPAGLNAARTRHWRLFAELEEQAALADGCAELDNLVAACRRAADCGDSASAAGALAGAWLALRMTGPFRVGISLASLVSAAPNLRRVDSAIVDWVAGSAAYLLGSVSDASSRLHAGLAKAIEEGMHHLEVRLRCALGELLMTAGRLDDAAGSLESALRLARALGHPRLECMVLNGQGALSMEQGKLGEAREQYEFALALAHRVGDQRWQGGLHSNLGALHFTLGSLEGARLHYEQAVALVRTVGDRRWEGSARCNLGLLLHEQGRYNEAREHLESALAIAREMGHAGLESTVLCNLGIVDEALGQLDDSRVEYERAVAIACGLGDRRSEGQFRGHLGRLYAKLGRLNEAQDCLASGEMLLKGGADQLSLGLLLCSRAQAECYFENLPAARDALSRAEWILAESRAGERSELGRAVIDTRQSIERSMH